MTQSPISKTTYHSIIATLVLLVGLSWANRGPAQQTAEDQLRALEQRINTTVRERGNVESRNAVEIRSPVQATILSVLPEGTAVNKNDVIIQLDEASLKGQLKQQQVAADLVKSKMVVAKRRAESVTTEFELRKKLDDLTIQVMEIEREQALGEDGELALQLKQASAELNIAKAKLSAAETVLKRFEEGSVSGTEAAGARAAATEARETIQVAEARQRFLQGPARKLQELKSQAELQRIQFEAKTAQAEIQDRQAAAFAEMTALDAEYAMAQARVTDTEEKLVLCTVRAPIPGLVVYIAGGRTQVSVGAGTQVRASQPLVRIVDPEQLVIRATVNESRISRVREGQPAVVEIDAFPGRKFAGKVEHVNNTPEPTSFLNANLKEYSVIVSFEEVPELLRVGLTALVEINTSDGVGNETKNIPDAARGSALPAGGRDLFDYDRNKDGKVSKDEAPEAMKIFFDRLDTDKDGQIERSDLDALRRRSRPDGGR